MRPFLALMARPQIWQVVMVSVISWCSKVRSRFCGCRVGRAKVMTSDAVGNMSWLVAINIFTRLDTLSHKDHPTNVNIHHVDTNPSDSLHVGETNAGQ